MGRTFRIVPNFSSFCLTDADLSLLSYHVSARTTIHMLAGAQRYICAFFGRLLKFESFWLFRPPKVNEPHSFKMPFLFVFSFFSGLARPSGGRAASFRKFPASGRCSSRRCLGRLIQGFQEGCNPDFMQLSASWSSLLVPRPP